MGWYFTDGASRKDIIAQLIVPYQDDKKSIRCETLRHCTRGNVLWTLHKTSGPNDTHRAWIGCYLLERSRAGWGYKPMDEDFHPYYYTCPISYIESASPAETDNAKAWRERCYEYAKQQLDKQRTKKQEISYEKINIRSGSSRSTYQGKNL